MTRSNQSGIGLFGFITLMALIGFFALVTMKTVPLYLNEMKIARAVHQVAIDPAMANQDPSEIQRFLQRRWDVEDATMLQPRDVKVVKMKDGRRALKYDYDARVNLFYNVYLVINFTGDEPMRVSSTPF